MKNEIFWAITGKHGLYVGTWDLRGDAVEFHTTHLWKTWKQCCKDGDRVIKVSVIPIGDKK